MTVDLSREVQTRDGRAVRILATDAKGRQPVIGLILVSCGQETHNSWSRDGRWNYDGDWSQNDLVNVPQQRTVWVNVYPDRYVAFHDSREAADRAQDYARIACIRVSYTEGQFDE